MKPKWMLTDADIAIIIDRMDGHTDYDFWDAIAKAQAKKLLEHLIANLHISNETTRYFESMLKDLEKGQ